MGCAITGQTSKLCMDSTTTKIAAAISYGASTNTGALDPTNSLQIRDYLQGGSHHGATDLVGNHLDQDGSTSGLQQMRWFFRVDD
jgi:hypothetical protein